MIEIKYIIRLGKFFRTRSKNHVIKICAAMSTEGLQIFEITRSGSKVFYPIAMNLVMNYDGLNYDNALLKFLLWLNFNRTYQKFQGNLNTFHNLQMFFSSYTIF